MAGRPTIIGGGVTNDVLGLVPGCPVRFHGRSGFMSLSIMDRLRAGAVLGAEGYVFELERRGYIKAGPFVPEVVLDFPDAVRELHREFLRAGADVMVALTYYAHREKLRDVGREDDLEAMNRQAVRIAREVAREGDALVAGNVCNTWAYDPDDPATKQTVRAMYAEQLGWAADEGVDFVISETNDYLGEALIALEVSRELGLPAMVTLAPTQPDQTRDGYRYAEACRILAAEGAQVVGLNCDRGPQTMLPLITDIREAVNCAVAVQPVPYRTDAAAPTMETLRSPDGERAFPIALDPFVLHALRDGALRAAGARTRRGLRGHLLRRRPASRPGHGRGAGPRGSGQQVLAVDGPAPHVPGRCRGQGRRFPAHLDRVTAKRPLRMLLEPMAVAALRRVDAFAYTAMTWKNSADRRLRTLETPADGAHVGAPIAYVLHAPARAARPPPGPRPPAHRRTPGYRPGRIPSRAGTHGRTRAGTGCRTACGERTTGPS